MEQLSKKANLKPIDPEKLKIEKIDAFPDAYAFELELDSTPDNVWEQIFEDEWKTSFYTMKRQVQVVGNRLRVVTAPDEVKDKIEWVKSLVKSTNERVETYNKEVERKNEAEKLKRAKERETIEKMRESLKK